MELSDFFYLGKIVKTHALNGNLSVLLETDEPFAYQSLQSVFILLKDGLIPFTITKLDIDFKGFALMSLENITTIEQAKKFVNKKLYLPLEFLPPLKGKQFYYHEVIGFDITDVHFGNVGKVLDVLDNGSQQLFRILSQNKEVLIPVHDDIIRKVDRKQKSILVDCPEGLLDIYLK